MLIWILTQLKTHEYKYYCLCVVIYILPWLKHKLTN